VKDSGERRAFGTGSVRDMSKGKGRFDLISPLFMQRFAKHMENGAVKYGDRNWELGQPATTFLDSALRHINKYKLGMRDEDHLAAAAWNLHCIIHFEELAAMGNPTAKAMMESLPTYVIQENSVHPGTNDGNAGHESPSVHGGSEEPSEPRVLSDKPAGTGQRRRGD
jgi:hypothetical protein